MRNELCGQNARALRETPPNIRCCQAIPRLGRSAAWAAMLAGAMIAGYVPGTMAGDLGPLCPPLYLPPGYPPGCCQRCPLDPPYHCCFGHLCCAEAGTCCSGTFKGITHESCIYPDIMDCCSGIGIAQGDVCCNDEALNHLGYPYSCLPGSECCDGGPPSYTGLCIPPDYQCCRFGDGQAAPDDGACCPDGVGSAPNYVCGSGEDCCKGACCGGNTPTCCQDRTGPSDPGYCCSTGDTCCEGECCGGDTPVCCTDGTDPFLPPQYCCQAGEACCGGDPLGQDCCPGDCLPSPVDGSNVCCDKGVTTLCVNGDDVTCCDGQCCGPADQQVCCERQTCQKCGPGGCEPVEDCSACGPLGAVPMPRCIGGVCGPPLGCGLEPPGDSVSGCPGSSLEATLNATCVPDCPGTVTVTSFEGVPDWMEPPSAGSASCPSDTLTVYITLKPNAPTGASATITVVAEVDGESECRASVTVTVIGPDLDVDSDNNGNINAADDPIEYPQPLTPENPRKWLWMNNNDDNGNGVPDNTGVDADSIDGANDLQDVGELKIRAVDPAFVPPGGTLELTTSDPCVVRVFNGRVPGISLAVLGPNIPEGGTSYVISPIPTVDLTYGIEGIESGTVDLSLTLKDSGGTILCQDHVWVTVVRVEIVEWDELADYSTPLTGCPNNGDKRIFPDCRYVIDTFRNDRNRVNLVATITPPVQDVRVKFRTWDVDDPFDQNNPAMPNVAWIDANAVGPDNKMPGVTPPPDPGVGQWTELTDATGKAFHTVTVSMQPGNNYRGGASIMVDGVDDAHVTQANVDAYKTPPAVGGLAPPPVKLSEMLTIWRHVWLELDSMGFGADIIDWGTINAITNNSPHAGDGTVTLGIPDVDDDGRFEGGSMLTAGGSTYTIIDNVDGIGLDDYTMSTLVAPGDLGVIGTIRDDDTAILPMTPNADITVLNAKYQNCYVEFTENDATRDNNNTFVATLAHAADAIKSVCRQNQDLHPAPDLWTALVLSGYQSYAEGDDIGENASSVDADPDFWYHIHGAHPAHTFNKVGDIGLTAGMTPVSTAPVPNFSVIFQEAISDYRTQKNVCSHLWPFHGRGETQEWATARIIAHEIGHQFGIVEHTVNSLINEYFGEDCELVAPQINYIRWSTKLGDE